MQILVRNADRVVVQYGTGLVAKIGLAVEELAGADEARFYAALAAATGDGGIVVSADHITITATPPTAAWTAAAAAAQAAQAMWQQHSAALKAMTTALSSDPVTTANDIDAVQALIAALQAGTAPTQAQLLHLLRFLLRAMAALNG